jgi:hypothetical protein
MKRVLLALVVLAVLAMACGAGSSEPAATSSPESRAWTACTMFVHSQLGISTSEAQRYAASQVSRSGDTFTIDVYYASVDAQYRCQILRHQNGDMELLSLAER